MFIYALIALAGLVISIVALSQLGSVSRAVTELTKRLADLERGDVRHTPEPETKPRISTPPPLPDFSTMPSPLPPVSIPPASSQPPATLPAMNWESIVGVKLFAWVGGLALFLGVVFFVKYAFDANLITPAMRIIAGAIVGFGLVISGILRRCENIEFRRTASAQPAS